MNFREFPRPIQIRIGLQFLTALATDMVVPFLVIYFAGRVGEVETTLMYVAVILSGVAGGLLGGTLADRYGRKRLMVAAEAIVFVTYLSIAFANSPWFDSVQVTFVLFLVNMFAVGMFGPAAQAMIIDLSMPESRKYVFGFMYWANNLAISIGGVIGGLFFSTHRFELFLVLAGVSLFSVLITLCFLQETYQPPRQVGIGLKKTGKQAGAGYAMVFRDLLFRHFLWASVLLFCLGNQLTNYIGVRMEQEMAIQPLISWLPFMPQVDGIGMVGILRAENTLLVVIGGLFISQLLKRFSETKVMSVGIGLYSIGFALLAVGNRPDWLLVSMLIVTLGELCYIPTKQALLGELTPEHSRSTYLAVNNLSGFAAMILAASSVAMGKWISAWMMGILYIGMGSISLYLLGKVVASMRRKPMVKSHSQ